MKKEQKKLFTKRRILLGVGLPFWVGGGFILAGLLTSVVVHLLDSIGVPLGAISDTVFMTVVAAFVYVLALVLVIGLPFKLIGDRTTKKELGLTGLPSWLDMALAPAGFIAYAIAAGLLLAIVARIFPGFDAGEAQDVGFENLNKYYEYLLAFITLVVVAPVAEEVLVRGYLYGKLRKVFSAVTTIAITAILFSLLHLGMSEDGSGVSQLNAALGLLPLGVVMAVLREMTGNIWASILLHMLKNGVAFYLLFVNTSIFNTIGG